jgi:hypothetical protein
MSMGMRLLYKKCQKDGDDNANTSNSRSVAIH